MSKPTLPTLAARVSRFCRSLRLDSRGNVLIILGFAMIPMTFAAAFGVDYSRAMKLRTRMNAAADAAALAAVNVKMMQRTDADATAAARTMFNSQVAGLQGMNYDPSTLAVDITSTGGVNARRTVTVSYTATSSNIFSGILGAPTLPVNGSATADATRAPHIDFYLLMDVSPSMLLPSTSAGLNAIRLKTTSSSKPNGCAFACHVKNPQGDGIYIRDNNGKNIWLNNAGGWCPVASTTSTKINCVNGTQFTKSAGQYADSYWLTRNYSTLYGGGSNISLRIDEEELAAQNLIPFAINTATNNQVTYRLQLFTFDWTHPGDTHPVKTITSSLQDVNSMATYDVPNFYSMQDNWQSNGCPTSSFCNDDKATEATNALTRMNTVITTPGDGTSASNPQKVLFIITDGISDELAGGSRWHREWSHTAVTNACAALKNRGIRIAILYTEYLPESLTGDSWSMSNVNPYLDDVEPALKNCASPRPDGSKLYYKVTTDESISAALTALFSLTVQSAHLTR